MTIPSPRYAVNDLYPCIQGEGSLTGTPMLMVRLQGCPVGCAFCDTKETWAPDDPTTEVPTLDSALGVNPLWTRAEADALAERMRRAHPGLEWVLVSGGEPLVQHCGPLAMAFRRFGIKCAVETSGTAPITGTWDFITVSPKVGMAGGRAIVPDTIRQADEIKWLVGRADDLTALDAFLTQYPRRHSCRIALQPLSQNEKATALAVAACLAHGYRLSVQLHKYVFPNWKTNSV